MAPSCCLAVLCVAVGLFATAQAAVNVPLTPFLSATYYLAQPSDSNSTTPRVCTEGDVAVAMTDISGLLTYEVAAALYHYAANTNVVSTALAKSQMVEGKTMVTLSATVSGQAYNFCLMQAQTTYSLVWTDMPQPNWANFRLPKYAVPTAYTVSLSPDFNTLMFSGECTVSMNITTFTRKVVMNQADLQIQVSSGRVNNAIANPAYTNIDNEMFVLDFGSGLIAGSLVVVTFSFQAPLNSDMHGFYKSSVKLADGTSQWMAATDFEPTDARRAFPCFDEPEYKAVFAMDVSVAQSAGLSTFLNNMPESRREEKDGVTRVYFQPTPPMSTYLVCLVIGNFDKVQDEVIVTAPDGSEHSTLVRVYTPPGKQEQGMLALNVGVASLKVFQNYLKTMYPLPKLDMIAIPDFASGGMENWGLITYRETALLTNADTTASQKQRVANVVAHEIAHQWFGDLITCEWWNEIWLNEGFASYFEYMGMDAAFPEWNVWEQFGIATAQTALDYDSLSSSHAVVNAQENIQNPADMRAVFDRITYDKGGSLLYMFNAFIGSERFGEALRRYFEARSFKTGNTEYLLDAIASVVSPSEANTIRAGLKMWTSQAGYPVVSFNMDQGQKGQYVQQRFQQGYQTNDNTNWWIPLFCENFDGLAGTSTENVLTLKAAPSGDFEFPASPNGVGTCNLRGQGFYRLQYPADYYLQAAQQILSEADSPNAKLEPATRARLIDDIFAFTKSLGAVEGDRPLGSIAHALSFVHSFLSSERAYVVWATALKNLGHLRMYLEDDADALALFHEYMRSQLQAVTESVGWTDRETDSHSVKQLRSAAIAASIEYNSPAVMEQARQKFADASATPIGVDVVAPVYDAVAMSGSAQDFNTLYDMYNKSTFAAEKVSLLKAMATTPTPALQTQLLNLVLNRDIIREQDGMYVLMAVSKNPHGGAALTWSWVQEHWETLFERYGQNTFDSQRLVGLVKRFSSQSRYEEAQAFYADKHGLAQSNVDSALTQLQANVAWRAAHIVSLKQWLASPAAMIPTTTPAPTPAATAAPGAKTTDSPPVPAVADKASSTGVVVAVIMAVFAFIGVGIVMFLLGRKS